MTWRVFTDPGYIIGSGIRPGLIQRIFITADPVLETNFTFQNTKTFPNDFDLSIDAVLPTAATTVTLYGQTASADHYIKVLSTGFVSINIDTSIVTSTVLATKDSKQRRYGVKLVGNDFIFTEDDTTIDTVTDAVAAAKTLIINAIGLSNGADFFDGKYADPKITDITTPSNSESWKINRAFPATTEQSSSGNNILTYNNAPDSTRELFTFIEGEWVGVDRIVNGGFNDGSDWTLGGTANITDGVASVVSQGGSVQQAFDVRLGDTLKVEWGITLAGAIGPSSILFSSASMFGAQPFFGDTVGAKSVIMTVTAPTAPFRIIHNSGGSTTVSFDNISAKLIIQIAT